MTADVALSAACGALAALCGRTLRETRDPASATLALGAMRCILEPQTPPPPSSEVKEPPEAASIRILLADLLAESAAQRETLSRLFVREYYARWMATVLGVGFDNWRGALTASQAAALFDCHVLSGAAIRSNISAVDGVARRAGGCQRCCRAF